MIKAATVSVNAHIENLKHQLKHVEPGQLDYLVIAHSDDRMLSHIKDAFVENSIALVAIPQSCWSMDDESMTELLDWATEELQVSGILLFGHSQGGTPSQTIQLCSSGQIDGQSDAAKNRISSIFDRVNHAQSCMQQNEKHFLKELELIRSSESIQSLAAYDPKFVQGLFYRAESGVFCVYDFEKQEFSALLNESYSE